MNANSNYKEWLRNGTTFWGGRKKITMTLEGHQKRPQLLNGSQRPTLSRATTLCEQCSQTVSICKQPIAQPRLQRPPKAVEGCAKCQITIRVLPWTPPLPLRPPKLHLDGRRVHFGFDIVSDPCFLKVYFLRSISTQKKIQMQKIYITPLYFKDSLSYYFIA